MRMHKCGTAAGWPLGVMMMTGRGWGRGWGGSWGGSDWGSDFGSGWTGRRGGGRGSRSRVFAAGELRLALLRLIADEPRHGYELIKAIEELTGGSYAPSPGVVYPTLNLLTDEGLVAEQAGEGTRRAYAVTDAGKAELADRADEATALIDRLKGMGEDRESRSAPPIGRAVANLFAALRNRATSGDFDRDAMHAVAEILDEAARKIERL